MTEKGKNIIDELRDRQPFRVPERYFDDFTGDFLRSLPRKLTPEEKKISFYDRVKPWLYLAAMIVGIIVLFNIFHQTTETTVEKKPVLSSINVDIEEEDDDEFFDYIKDQYADKYAFSYIFDDYLID